MGHITGHAAEPSEILGVMGTGAVGQCDGHPAARASPSITPVPVKVQGCVAINHVQATAGMTICAILRAVCLSSALPLQALKHSKYWAGQAEVVALGLGTLVGSGSLQGALLPCTTSTFSSRFLGAHGGSIREMEDLVAFPWSRAPAVAASPHFGQEPPAAASKEGTPESSSSMDLLPVGSRGGRGSTEVKLSIRAP